MDCRVFVYPSTVSILATLKDYYQILKLDRTAAELEIKKQYRKLALELHPDKNHNPTAAQRFIELTEAYEVLSNRARRKHYDELLAYEEQRKGVNEKNRQRWQQEVNRASERGQRKGQEYAENFDFFSKKVIIGTSLIIFFEVLLAVIVEGEVFSFVTLSFVLTVAGFIVLLINWGNTELMALGIGMTILGFFLFRWAVRREFERWG